MADLMDDCHHMQILEKKGRCKFCRDVIDPSVEKDRQRAIRFKNVAQDIQGEQARCIATFLEKAYQEGRGGPEVEFDGDIEVEPADTTRNAEQPMTQYMRDELEGMAEGFAEEESQDITSEGDKNE